MKRGKYLLLTVTAAALLAAIPFQAFASKDTGATQPGWLDRFKCFVLDPCR